MACPLYISPQTRNSLEVCGPGNAITPAPSHAHVHFYCGSVLLYKDCPFYEFKISQRKAKISLWAGFLKKIILPFLPREVKTEGENERTVE